MLDGLWRSVTNGEIAHESTPLPHAGLQVLVRVRVRVTLTPTLTLTLTLTLTQTLP